MKHAVKQVLAKFVDLDLEITTTRNNHLKVTLPNGRFVFMASTPSDRRNALNTRAQIRRAIAGRTI
jgi:hypothetical protein